MVLYIALQAQRANQIDRVIRIKRNPKKSLADFLWYFIANNSEQFMQEWIFILKLENEVYLKICA